MRDTLQLMKVLTLTDGFNDSWVEHGLSDDVAVLRSRVATLPLSSFADLGVSTIWVKKLLLRFLAVGTLTKCCLDSDSCEIGVEFTGREEREDFAVSDCNADAQVVLG